MSQKKSRVLTYFTAAMIPVFIFGIALLLSGYLKDEVPFNPYDAYYQYPSMTLEFIRNLSNGNIFYSFRAGLGFNLLGAICYYCMGPLNLLAIWASSQNYPVFIAFMTFLRFSLLGLSMCFYLEHKGLKATNVVLFSTIYSLMGFTSTYFYNFMWIDSIIFLPLVIHGLDKLLENKSGVFYAVTLTLAIISNYYIGYMICIFSVIWFFYKIFFIKDKKQVLKKFIIYSVFAGLMSSIVLIPSFFALMTGKGTLFTNADYSGISNLGVFTYMLSTGAYSAFSYLDGPALIYSGIISIVLLIFYFGNSKISKKEKFATLIIIIFFYLSFTVNFLNCAWQLFQKPIWWQSRFSFLFSFFLIVLAARTYEQIEFSKLKTLVRFIISFIIIALFIIGDCLKHGAIQETLQSTAVYIGLSSVILFALMFLIDRHRTFVLIALFTILDLTMNSFNVLVNIKNSATFREEYSYLKKEIPASLERIEDENFYRFDSTESYTAMDGLYFGYNGIDYFNSARNIKVIDFFKKIGASVQSDCYVALTHYDPLLYSLLNVGYIYGGKTDYYEEIGNKLYRNKYPLSIGFMGEKDIKQLKLSDDIFEARETVVKTLSGRNEKIYTSIYEEDFKEEIIDDKIYYTYSFESTGDFFPIAYRAEYLEINGEKYSEDEHPILHKKDNVRVVYQKVDDYLKVELHLLSIDSFEDHMKDLSTDLLEVHTNVNGHILEGKITVSDENKYFFSTIGYERGMKIYVDGKAIEPDVILGALIGFDLSKGDHTIVIDYVSEGLRTGVILSITGVISLTIYTIKKKKNKTSI